MKIAIIGTGISGLGISYLLHPHHDITVYEKNHYHGGHSRTIMIPDGGKQIPVDTGFIVYNEKNYPHLTAMFRHLGVRTEKSAMSFGASVAGGWLEYASTGMFAQKSNIFRPRFWGMIRDILKFNKQAMDCIRDDADITLRECLDRLKLGQWFRDYYLLAMGAAIWSCSVETMLDFPAKSFLQFFENHGLLTINGHPQWYTVSGGSREYVRRLTAPFSSKIKSSCSAVLVVRDAQGVTVTDTLGGRERYDKVVFACHADEALKMLAQPTEEEVRTLGAFSYQPNSVYVHSDESFMPRRKKCWASWIYLSEGRTDRKPVVSLSYWMNNLQNLKTEKPVLVTLNPGREPEPSKMHNKHVFSHPVFNLSAIRAQKNIPALQGQNHSYFCGAYQRYGFHEDGLLSAVNVAEKMGIAVPWI